MFNKLKESDEIKSIVEVFGENSEIDVISVAASEHEFLQKGISQDKEFKPRGYGPLVMSLAKGKLFDELAKELTKIKKENEILKKKIASGLPPPKGVKKSEEGKVIEQKDDDENPLDFLQRR